MMEAIKNPNLQDLDAYADLPPVANANRVIRPDGLVDVGAKGAPKIGKPTMSNDEAMKAFEALGMPKGTAYYNIQASGDANKLIQLFPKGSKYLGEGVEGVGIALPGNKVALRIQHGGGKPLLQADVGKAGVYADWMTKYGKTWVEQKERIAVQAKHIPRGLGQFNVHDLKAAMERNFQRQGKNVHGVDDHMGNWGIDYRGRARVFDAGAYRPPGDNKVAAIWDGADY
jgi:hypothetical protein